MSISVIIPAFNSMKYLKETLDSVFAQTLPADEVLVIDDGSTDDTGALAESYGSPVKVFRCANQRQAAGRNFGALQAKSEWLAFLDHDDVWTPDKLQRQMQKLADDPRASLCYTGRRLLEQTGQTFALGRIVETPPVNSLARWLEKDVAFLPSSVLIRRSTFLTSGGFNPSFRYVEDWDLWMRLLQSGCEFAFCPEPLLRYRVHDDNTSADARAQLREIGEVYRTHIVPRRCGAAGWLSDGRFWSRFEAEGAFNLRRTGDPGCLALMFRSILHWPAGDLHRYKVFAHMLHSRWKHANLVSAAGKG